MNYRADLIADLRESAEFAAEYLSAAYSDSRGAFLVALRDVVEARKGIAKVAAQARVNRESLYRCLSDAGNPTLNTLNSIWDVLGLEIEFKAKAAKPKAAPVTPGESLVANAAISTTSTEFRNVATIGNNIIFTDAIVSIPEEQPTWASTSAGIFLPGFIANATGTDQSTINALGD